LFPILNVGRDNAVGIATRYGPGIESRCGGGEIFRTGPDRPWRSPSLLFNWYRVSFPVVKRPRHAVDHPLSSPTEGWRVGLFGLL